MTAKPLSIAATALIALGLSTPVMAEGRGHDDVTRTIIALTDTFMSKGTIPRSSGQNADFDNPLAIVLGNSGLSGLPGAYRTPGSTATELDDEFNSPMERILDGYGMEGFRLPKIIDPGLAKGGGIISGMRR